MPNALRQAIDTLQSDGQLAMGVLVLIRHGNCLKNVERIHGGAGSALTETGREQAKVLAVQLARRGISPISILMVDRPQCTETARILARELGRPRLTPLSFEPFFLGVLAGLSEEECARRYPTLAKDMTRYRQGEIEIAEVNIPGASDPATFFDAAQATLRTLLDQLPSGDVLVVGTRSVLVGLLNIALGRSPVIGGGYREIPWANCGCCSLSPSLVIVGTNGVTL